MRRREQREHIFKLLFMSEFNSQKEMEEQLALYFADIENLEEKDKEYISKKYMNIIPKNASTCKSCFFMVS